MTGKINVHDLMRTGLPPYHPPGMCADAYRITFKPNIERTGF